MTEPEIKPFTVTAWGLDGKTVVKLKGPLNKTHIVAESPHGVTMVPSTPQPERNAEIVRKYRAGARAHALAEEYDLTPTRIYYIIRRAHRWPV